MVCVLLPTPLYFNSVTKLIVLQNIYNTVPEEERAHGTISNKTYFTYVKAGGNTLLVLFLIAVYLISQVLIVCMRCAFIVLYL